MLDKKTKLICDALKNVGLLSPVQIQEACRQQEKTKEDIENVLAKLNYITKEKLSLVMKVQLGMVPIDLPAITISPTAIKMVPANLAHQYKIVPVKHENGILTVAMANVLDIMSIDTLRLALGCTVEAVMADRDDLEAALEKHYPAQTDTVDTVIHDLTEEHGGVEEETEEARTLKEDDAPVVRLVNLWIQEAHRSRASDIHIEPLADRLRIRYRIDGVLHEVPAPSRRMQAAVISRIKLIAGMDIAEKRLPQDGRISMSIRGTNIDLRVSTLPATYGESLVLRILDKGSMLKSLPDLGFLEDDMEKFEQLIESPNGILLVTGPTGSGKTTTLYTALSRINRPNRKLITVEEPVEYQIPGINQVEVRPQIDLTFASGLRSILRQAPDVIMVGEIRDLETAEIAVQASLTGHLVFSTLHTNDAPGAITRLIDMGVKPYQVASSVQAILAQRLVRKICPNCKEAYLPGKDELVPLAISPDEIQGVSFYHGKGCKVCADTGYQIRIGIFELLIVNDEIRKLIFEKVAAGKIREAARRAGMRTLREDGVRKAKAGITTLAEVLRITQSDID